MADLPNASVVIDDEAGGFSGAADYCTVLAPVATNADSTPRVYSSAKALLTQHGYSAGADYAALHIEKTGLPVLFVGMPIATAGTIGRIDSTGVTGTSQISVAADSNGVLDEVEGVLTVVTGGTIGVNGITFDLSMDGGRTTKRVRLGTASSYTVPYVGVVISFGAGTLVADDEFTFSTKAPMWDSAGLTAARTALAAQQKMSRSWMVIGDVANSTFAGYVTTQVNAYETSNDRFVYARAAVKDRSPIPTMSKITKRMVGAPSLTFAEVGATGDTITRATGSWVTDGFTTGDLITVSGTASNNFSSAVVTNVTATVLTLDTQDLVAEVTAAATVTASPTLTFAEVGATGDTITRSSGSWLNDGFAAGDAITVSGTASNNFSSATVTNVTATVLTLDTQDLVGEVVRQDAVTIVKTQTMAAYVSAMDSAFASVDDQKRVDLSIGRARIESPITGWALRRPAAWAASIREYQYDLHIATFQKKRGPLDGFDMTDGDGTVVEYDDRTDGGGLAGRFTCLRTWSNGPNGAFVAMSLTRATEGTVLSRTHNMAVANLACTITQAETENVIGESIVLNSDGTGSEASLQQIEERVNSKLEAELLKQSPDGGQRASRAVWSASRTDDLSEVPATLNGTLELLLNGTVEQIATRVKINATG